MSTTEPQIIITRSENKISTISAVLPVKTERSFDGSLKVQIPLLEAEIWVIDESGVEKGVEGVLRGLCWACENFGKGMEKELEAIGWIRTEGMPGESILTFENTFQNLDLRRILRTSDNHVTKKLQVT